MNQLVYAPKSPEKSSPSFPEDVEDDDELVGMDHVKFGNHDHPNHEQQEQEQEPPTDVTMLPEDEDDDDLARAQSFVLTTDSPKHPMDSSEKKVHWSNQNVQTLLDCVEKHLDEFNVQKKHKQVWQTIGAEMEALGFTMEHCYNKWKNLRRDVRLLVNNPQKAVRNADVLRRVARLILVIYPNIDASTMQVQGDRSSGKSAPVTPLGSVNHFVSRFNGPNTFHAPDSPQYNATISSAACHSPIPQFSLALNGARNLKRETAQPLAPSTALFNNLGSDTDVPETQDFHHIPTSTDKVDSQASPAFPFFFNPAAAALLVQSQLFTDLLRQQQHSQEDECLLQQQQQQQLQLQSQSTPDQPVGGHHEQQQQQHIQLQQTTPKANNNSNGDSVPNGDHLHRSNTAQTVSLAATLLNGLSSTTIPPIDLPVPASTMNNTANPLDRLPPGSELAGVVERLRDEETIHMRLTDMVTHIADELRAAGMRRRAALDQLLGIMQGSHMPTAASLISKSDPSSNLV